MPCVNFEGLDIDYDDVLYTNIFDGSAYNTLLTISAVTHSFALRNNFDNDDNGISSLTFFKNSIGKKKDEEPVIRIDRGDVYVIYIEDGDLVFATFVGEEAYDFVEDWNSYKDKVAGISNDDLIDTLKNVFKDSGVKMITIDGDNVKTEVL